jgi:hypothetical protein
MSIKSSRIVSDQCKTLHFTSILANLANISPPPACPVPLNVVYVQLQRQNMTRHRLDFINFQHLSMCDTPTALWPPPSRCNQSGYSRRSEEEEEFLRSDHQIDKDNIKKGGFGSWNHANSSWGSIKHLRLKEKVLQPMMNMYSTALGNFSFSLDSPIYLDRFHPPFLNWEAMVVSPFYCFPRLPEVPITETLLQLQEI